MSLDWEKLIQYLIPLGIIAAALLFSLFFKKYINVRLRKLTQKTRWRGDDIILNIFEKSIVLWFFLGSVYIAVNNAPLPENVVNGTGTIIVVAAILSVTFAISRVSVDMLRLYADSTGGVFPSTTMVTNLGRIVIITIGLLVTFQTLGISVTPILTALGVGGLAVSLALKDTLSDLFSGLHILLSKKMKPGDLIALEGGERGTVENISWRDTTIRDRLNNLIVIPNSKLSTAMITNFDIPEKSMVVRVECGVAYDSNLEQVEEVALDVARKVLNSVDGGDPTSDPRLRFHTFGESSIDFRVSMMATDYLGSFRLQHEFIKHLHKRFNEENISIPFPIRTIYHADE